MFRLYELDGSNSLKISEEESSVIDIHCHILPGIDDGAKTLTDSMEMAQQAVREGIHTIIATPHHKDGVFENKKADIIQKVDKLNTYITKENIPLRVLPGQEIRLYGEIVTDYEKGEILPLAGNSSYIFIEFPPRLIPLYTEQLLFDIQLKGLHPIIVHPERNVAFIKQPELLYQLVRNGAFTQITASSLVGYFGKKIQSFTRQLIEANLAHFIASDAHNVTSRDFKMEIAYDFLDKKYGNKAANYFTKNAELLIGGEYVMKAPPKYIKKKKKFFGFI